MGETLLLFLSEATVWEITLRIVCGVIIGLCLGMTGVGGGVLIIPILQLVFRMNPVLAVGTASLITALAKIGASFSHVNAGNVVWKHVFFVLLGSAPATIVTAYTVASLSNNAIYSSTINQIVQLIILAVMLLSLFSMVWKYVCHDRNIAANGTTPKDSETNNSKIKAITSGAGCGIVLGATGIGGGVLLLPVLNTILGINIKKAVGSSIVIALVLSTVSALSYSSGGQSDSSTAIIIAAGALLSSPIAVRLVRAFTEKTLYMLTIQIILVSFVTLMVS